MRWRSPIVEDEISKSFLDYAMSVIVSRALPDVKDGLKPVQRRILYSMYETGIRPTGPFRKCSKVVGDVMGNYHPHGNEAIYGTLVRLGQHFSTRYPLIEPQGNFGTPKVVSLEGTPPNKITLWGGESYALGGAPRTG